MRIEQEHIDEAVDAIADSLALLELPSPDFDQMMDAMNIDPEASLHLFGVLADLQNFDQEQQISFAFVAGVISARKAMTEVET